MAKTPDETSYAFRELARELDSLLNWAVEPWPNPLDDNWLEGTKRGIRHAARVARNATRDRVIADKVFAANCKGVEFARLLCDRPKLSTIPVEEWTVPKYRLLFDDLAALAREFHRLGEEGIEAASAQPVASASAADEKPKPGKPRTTKSQKPTVKQGNNPQITIEGEPYLLSYEQAHWLDALIDAGDWMSDRKYNRDNNTPNSRPDRLRKDLPAEVLAHITTTNIGSRWL